jgi:hypothetical protein
MNRAIAWRLALLVAFALSAVRCTNFSPANQAPTRQAGSLTMTFPLETTELVGGQSLRVTASLVDHNDRPVEGATVQAELQTPNGDVLATLPCADKGQGRYLSDYVRLPLRGTEGTWRVVVRATWGDECQAQTEQTFKGLSSFSEELQSLYGFWIELSDLFPYNVPHAGDPRNKYWPYEDGGYVILANNFFRGGTYGYFVMLDVHWRHADLPTDEAAAIAYVQSLAGPHGKTMDIPATNLVMESASFRGWPAWRVTGYWESTPSNGNPPPGGLVEWMVFPCPGSDWLWTVAIATNDAMCMDDLRTLRETFECSTPRVEARP